MDGVKEVTVYCLFLGCCSVLLGWRAAGHIWKAKWLVEKVPERTWIRIEGLEICLWLGALFFSFWADRCWVLEYASLHTSSGSHICVYWATPKHFVSQCHWQKISVRQCEHIGIWTTSTSSPHYYSKSCCICLWAERPRHSSVSAAANIREYLLSYNFLREPKHFAGELGMWANPTSVCALQSVHQEVV